ncbi:MAG: prepilin peptidase [Lachnospiraceae bacterium]|nr:prepilin peptidase [Lachnospiraceae bacterium]
MIVFLYILAIILAWMIGTVSFSFVNVIAYRFPKQKKILKEHFKCDSCEMQLKPYETIPVFSYIFLKGRCRYCGEKLSVRDFVNEIAGGIIALLVFFRFGDVDDLSSAFILSSPIDIVVHFDIWKLLTLLTIFVFFCILDLVFLVDMDTMEIPNRFIIVMLYVAVVALLVVSGVSLIDHIIGALCISIPMLLIMYAIPGAFGGGDVKLSAAAGLIMGWQLTIIGFIIGLFAAGIYGIILLIRKKKGKKDHFAFGPFLCTGYMIATICGMDIIDAYMKFAAYIHG